MKISPILMAATLLFLFCVGFIPNGYTSNIITTLPVNTVGCYGARSTFYCGSNRGDVARITFLLNGYTVDENSVEILRDRGIVITREINSEKANSSLSILGLPINDGILIGCEVTTHQIDSDTKAATFTVSDIPPVEDLMTEFSSTEMTVTWSEPSCLPINCTYFISISIGRNAEPSININSTDSPYTMPVQSSFVTTNYTVSVIIADIKYTFKQSPKAIKTKTFYAEMGENNTPSSSSGYNVTSQDSMVLPSPTGSIQASAEETRHSSDLIVQVLPTVTSAGISTNDTSHVVQALASVFSTVALILVVVAVLALVFFLFKIRKCQRKASTSKKDHSSILPLHSSGCDETTNEIKDNSSSPNSLPTTPSKVPTQSSPKDVFDTGWQQMKVPEGDAHASSTPEKHTDGLFSHHSLESTLSPIKSLYK